jgi:hypothetical protein
MLVFQLGNVTWFSALIASSRKSALMRSLNRNVRAIDALRVNCPGPVIEFLPALPQCPAAGALTAAGLRNSPDGAEYNEAWV